MSKIAPDKTPLIGSDLSIQEVLDKELLWKLHNKIFNIYSTQLPNKEDGSSFLMAEIDRIFIAMLCGKEHELID